MKIFHLKNAFNLIKNIIEKTVKIGCYTFSSSELLILADNLNICFMNSYYYCFDIQINLNYKYKKCDFKCCLVIIMILIK